MQKTINLTFDKRLEVLSVLYDLTDYVKEYPFLVCTDEKSLYKKTLTYFEPYKNHQAIRIFNQLMKNENFGYDAPVELFTQFNADLSGFQLRDYPYRNRLHTSPLVIELMEATMKFVKDSNFEAFYQSNQTYYETILSQSMNLDIHSVFKFMRTYYGKALENHEFRIVLMSGTTNGNYGLGFENKHICVTGLRNGSTYIDTSTVLHEFSHPIINPLVEKYIPNDLIDDLALFKDINDQLSKIGYGQNVNNLQEYFIRSVECVFAKTINDEKYQSMLAFEKERGFVDVEVLADFMYPQFENPIDFDTYFEKCFKDFISYLKNK